MGGKLFKFKNSNFRILGAEGVQEKYGEPE